MLDTPAANSHTPSDASEPAAPSLAGRAAGAVEPLRSYRTAPGIARVDFLLCGTTLTAEVDANGDDPVVYGVHASHGMEVRYELGLTGEQWCDVVDAGAEVL